MTVLVTGAAGFIGHHVTLALLARGDQVIGIDNMNSYYDVKLKEARLARLQGRNGFSFEKLDISDREGMFDFFRRNPTIDRVVHLAGQAGVRYSLIDPYSYIQTNVLGQVVMIEGAKTLPHLKHFVYASSSSIYGANTEIPFSIDQKTDSPVSLYGATKKADELMMHAYAHLFRLPSTGLRFFTVYGPWGRPDMAAYLFLSAMVKGEPIKLFNYGEMRRDFTYVDDIVQGVIAALDHPPADDGKVAPHRVYNLGNHKSERLRDFVACLEKSSGITAKIIEEPIQPGDVPATYADIEASTRDLGFHPTTDIAVGLERFVQWYKEYHKV